jgi:hypothetical protein
VDYGASWERVPWDRGPFDSPTAPRYGALDPEHPGNLIIGTTSAGVREYQISPNLSLSLSGLPATNVAGSTPTLRLTVRNRPDSLFAAADATASLTLPAVLVPGTLTTSRGTCTRAGQSVTCRLGAMPVGDTVLIDVALATTTGTGTVTASAQPREQELLPSDNQAALAVTVKPVADLGVSLSGVPASIIGAIRFRRRDDHQQWPGIRDRSQRDDLRNEPHHHGSDSGWGNMQHCSRCGELLAGRHGSGFHPDDQPCVYRWYRGIRPAVGNGGFRGIRCGSGE